MRAERVRASLSVDATSTVGLDVLARWRQHHPRDVTVARRYDVTVMADRKQLLPGDDVIVARQAGCQRRRRGDVTVVVTGDGRQGDDVT